MNDDRVVLTDGKAVLMGDGVAVLLQGDAGSVKDVVVTREDLQRLLAVI